MRISDWVGAGQLPLRDHAKNLAARFRNVPMASRPATPTTNAGPWPGRDKYGAPWPESMLNTGTENTEGDLNNASLWPADPTAGDDRKIPGWALTPWASKVTTAAPPPQDYNAPLDVTAGGPDGSGYNVLSGPVPGTTQGAGNFTAGVNGQPIALGSGVGAQSVGSLGQSVVSLVSTYSPPDPTPAGQGPGAPATQTKGGTGLPQTPPSPRPQNKFRPIRSEKWNVDLRFKEQVVSLPDMLDSLPKDWPGTVEAGTEETSQEDLFTPAGGLLCAPYHGGWGALGTPVFDVQSTADPKNPGFGALDRVLVAPIQSRWRVFEIPATAIASMGLAGRHALACQHGPAKDKIPGAGMFADLAPLRTTEQPQTQEKGGATATGGIYSDTFPGGDGSFPTLEKTPTTGPNSGTHPKAGAPATQGKAPGPTNSFPPEIISPLSYRLSGFLTPGYGKFDQHYLGVNRFGDEFSVGGADTNGYFVMDGRRTGPIDFEATPFPKGLQEFPIKVRAHIAFDESVAHPFIGGPRVGKWRVYSSTAFYTPVFEDGDDTGGGGGTTTGGGGGGTTTGGGGGTGTDGGGGGTTDGGGGGSATTPGTTEIATGTRVALTGLSSFAVGTPITKKKKGAASTLSSLTHKIGGLDRPYRQKTTNVSALATWMDLQAPQISFRAQNYDKAATDVRNVKAPALTDLPKRSPTVGQIVAVANQLGQSFNYTKRPGTSKYPGGSANGNLWVLPGDVDVTDILDGKSIPTQSITNLAVYNTGHFGWGTPQKTIPAGSSGVSDGYVAGLVPGTTTQWYLDATGADGTPDVNALLADAVAQTLSSFGGLLVNYGAGSNGQVPVANGIGGGSFQNISSLAGTSAWFGDGSDGVATFAGGAVTGASLAGSIYTLQRDVYYADGSSISSGFQIVTNGYRFHCNGTFTQAINSTIHNNGGAGGNGGTGAGTSGGVAGTAGSAAGSGSIPGVGGVGGAGQGAGGASGVGGGNVSNTSANTAGGAGGAGFSTAAGSGGTATSLTANQGGFHTAVSAALGQVFGAGAVTGLQGGAGGGGGGGVNSSGTSCGGGGGGGGAGVVVLCIKIFVWNGNVKAQGGDGGTGISNGVDSSGGGGGGGGGTVFIVSTSITGTQSSNVHGGNGGLSGGTTGGVNGSNGSNGTLVVITV